MKFSVIVPCYNVEQYIDECMHSIINQTYQDFEVILVDDGSTDRTHEKCKQWHDRDSRIKLITKENGGLSAARNSGMDVAQGDYLVFVDSDDVIEKESLSSFDNALQCNEDALITRWMEWYPDQLLVRDKKIEDLPYRRLSQEEAIDWYMNKSEDTWPAQKTIINRQFVVENKLRFKENIINEDIDWTTQLCSVAHSFGCCSYPWYNHRCKRPGSIGTLVTSKQVTTVIDIAYSYIYGDKKYMLEAISEKSRKATTKRLMRSVYACLAHYKALDSREREYTIQYIEQYRKIFHIAPSIQHKLFRCVMDVCGVHCAMRLYALLLK